MCVLIFSLTVLALPNLTEAKPPPGPYAPAAAKIKSVDKQINYENKKKEPNPKTLVKLKEKISEIQAGIAEEHAKNKKKHLDKKLEACQKKLDAGGDKAKINKKIAAIKKQFELEYESYYKKTQAGNNAKKDKK